MKSFSAPLVALAVFAAGVAGQSFTINTPNPPVQCVKTQFTWVGGTAPFFLQIVPGGIPGATALQQFQNIEGSPFAWLTNIAAGTSLGLSLTDANGNTALSAPFTVASGPDSSCLNATSTLPQTPATTGAASTSGGSNSSPTTGGQTQTSKSTSASNTQSASAGATSAAGGTNGALMNGVSAGIVGVVGAVAAAILV